MNKKWLYLLLVAALVLIAATVALLQGRPEPLRIGVLFSLTGTMAENEKPLVDAVRLAVEEINQAGGVLGRPVEMLVADGKSDDAVFATEAERLIRDEKVSALFACWTSSCRKAVKPVVEKYQHLMFYSLQYEGLEQSEHIFYTGATANQQVIPGAQWAMEKFGKRVYLVGSDYIFPHIANLLIHDALQAQAGTVLAEQYRPLASSNFADVVADIARLQPDVVFNTINGSSNRDFFRALHDAGLGHIPVMSFSITEVGLQEIGRDAFYPQHYAVWSYFASLPGLSNRQFTQAFKARYGQDRLTNDPVEATYVAVKLWSQALRDAGVDDVLMVRRALLQQSIAAPSGIAAVDRNTQHLWKPVHIGQARTDFQFDILWSSDGTLRPTPFPDYRTRYEWEDLLAQQAIIASTTEQADE